MYRSYVGQRLLQCRNCSYIKHSFKDKNLNVQCIKRANSTKPGKQGFPYFGASIATIGTISLAAIALANYNEDFRRNIETTLPFIQSPLKEVLGELPVKINILEEKVLPSEENTMFKDEKEEMKEDTSPMFVDSVSSKYQVTINVADMPGVAMLDLDMSNIPSSSTTEEKNVPTKTEQYSSEIGATSKMETTSKIEENESNNGPSELKLEGPLTSQEVDALCDLMHPEALEVVVEVAIDNLRTTSPDILSAQHSAASAIRQYKHKFADVMFSMTDRESESSLWEEMSQLEVHSQEKLLQAEKKLAEMETQIEIVKKLATKINKNEVTIAATQLLAKCEDELMKAVDDRDAAAKELHFLIEYGKITENSIGSLNGHLKRFAGDFVRLFEVSKDIDVSMLSTNELIINFALKKLESLGDSLSASVVREKEQRLLEEREKFEREKLRDLHSQIDSMESKYEDEMMVQLKRQASAHKDVLADELSTLEANLVRQHKTEMEETLMSKDKSYQSLLERNVMYLNGVESKIDDLVDVDKKQRRIHQLWLAAQALNDTLMENMANGRTRVLMPEIMSLLQIGGSSSELQEIAETIPKAAALYGVVTEKDLLQRFKRVKNVCKKVAMIGDDGGSLMAYALSYIKSYLVISPWYQRNTEEPLDLSNLETYEILAKAEYYIEKGDLVQSAKFISQLEGVSQKMCSDWLNEVLLLLETKQTVNMIIAYAASLAVEIE